MTDPDDPDVPLLSRRLSRRQLIGLDCAAAAVFAVVLASFGVHQRGGLLADAPAWAEAVIVAAMSLPLAARRVRPRTVLAVVMAASLAALAVTMVRDSFSATAFALYTVALTTRRLRGLSATVVGVATVFGLLVLSMGGTTDIRTEVLGQVLIGAVVLGGTWTVGQALRERRAHARRAAERHAENLLAEERLHIARELHDVVAHSMSLIAVKAAVANHVARRHPAEAHRALEVIESTSRGALGEMRRILGVLRSERDDAETELAPAPGVAELPGLVRRAAQAGVAASLDARGVEDLPSGVGLSVYRIAQEAVTNVVKHAGPANCRITVEADDARVRIAVRDDGAGPRHGWRSPDGESAGHGLIGMAERAGLLGGRFHAGPADGGGFVVEATLPLRDKEMT
ncbi:MAG TPA: histidine kinase [Stackebrandtia sp.]|uniref:sensor histidine kinase n=1 Tax=Stackebrandtia sp. TaxID=2023065 RepID=UPI002D52BBCB|nr:histidine kinase [Stackebrandtia sp.]HZE38795.1 histidine kinase [Stackebrandtia sp.]